MIEKIAFYKEEIYKRAGLKEIGSKIKKFYTPHTVADPTLLENYISRIKGGDDLYAKSNFVINLNNGKYTKDTIKPVLDYFKKNTGLRDNISEYQHEIGGKIPPIITDKKKWNKDYLMRQSSRIMMGQFDKDYLKHLADVADEVYKNKRRFETGKRIVGTAAVPVVGVGALAYRNKKNKQKKEGI